MRWIAIAAAAVLATSNEGHAAAPLYDTVVLNLGVNCQWQQRCIARQRRAMNDARKYIAKYDPPLWRIHLCNRNAAKSPQRVDWVGFNNCIRNASLRPPPPPARARKTRRH
jgi:hypothetical protein